MRMWLLAIVGALFLAACPPAEGEDGGKSDAGAKDTAAGQDLVGRDLTRPDTAGQDAGTGIDTNRPACTADDSYEPNNTESEAKPITVPGTISDLKACDEYDWFSFSVPAGSGASVSITFTHADADLDLRLYTAGPPSEVVDTSAGTGNSEEVEYEYAAAETPMLVRVLNYDLTEGGWSAYTMTVEFVAGGICNDDSSEENDTPETATAIASFPKSGTICTTDLDYYKFAAPATLSGARLIVNRGATALTLELTVEGTTTPIGVQTEDNDNGRSTITFDSTEATNYILKIALPGGAGVVDYVIDFKGPPPPNDLCAGAIALQANQSVSGSTAHATNDYQFVSGTISCTGYGTSGPDVAYQVTIPAGQYLSAWLYAPTDMSMYLVDDCATLCCWGGIDEGYSGDTEVLVYNNAVGSAQNLYLIVDSFSSSGGADFGLGVAVAAAPSPDAGVEDSGTGPAQCIPNELP
ncbi:MAG: PPC domain-containing protein [Deltaproteobacteria bacterium]|nr:PPC domain-containing protein [Deltaproteobacteria bacterium]